MTQATQPIDVAVGVLIRSDGAFLIAQRPEGKPMPGYWEFPGGKVEPGESIFDALVREFIEELGITITVAHPWTQRVFVYPHATVRLHFWRATAWTGEPRSLEDQAFQWEHIAHIKTDPWLPGALPLKRWLQLPALYAISNVAEMGIAPFLQRLDTKLADGSLKMLQLREKTLDDMAFDHLFNEVQARTRTHNVRLLVNSDHPETYWHKADGVHCTSKLLMSSMHKPATAWCGASCHNATEVARAGELGFDFAVLGPVKATATHPDTQTLGWNDFRSQSAATNVPVYALGGLSFLDIPNAIVHGAQGIAGIRALWNEPLPI